MTCKDCIHYELCDVQVFNGLNKNFEPEKDWKYCGVFKDKSKYIELHTVDAEPVVRCKDCKYLLKRNMLCLHKRNRVFNTGLNVYENHYCSYGAKMDEEQECEI